METAVKKSTVLDILYGILSKIRDGYKNNRVIKALKLDKGENIYCIYFAIIFFYYYFRTTTIEVPMTFIITLKGFVGIIYTVAWFKMAVLDLEDKWDLVRYVLSAALGYVCFQMAQMYGGWPDLVVYYFLIVSARKVDFRKIALTALVIGAATTLIVSVFSPFGWYPNLIYDIDPPVRHSFGFVFPTDYGAHICFLALLFFWLRKGRLEILDLVLYAGMAAFIFIFCSAKTDTACILMIMVFGIAFRFGNMTDLLKKCGVIAVWAIPVLAAAAIVLTICYNENNGLYQFIHAHFDSVYRRFETGHRVLTENGVSVFGKIFVENGQGGKTNLELENIPATELTFLDISYVKILLRMGIAAIAAICISYPCFVSGRLKKNDLITAAVWFIIAVNCAFAHHFIDLSYNVFLFMLFADLSGNDKKPSPPYSLKRKV